LEDGRTKVGKTERTQEKNLTFMGKRSVKETKNGPKRTTKVGDSGVGKSGKLLQGNQKRKKKGFP